MSRKPLYKRVLLKISGESLMGDQKFGVEHGACEHIASAVHEVYALGVEVAIVVGGGNIFRGAQAESLGFDRTPADQIGMLATCINGLVLQQSLSLLGLESIVMSATSNAAVEPYSWKKAHDYLNKKIIVIFVGGTGNPYFTTDTAAALRASEMKADALLKATKVDGIYTDDPNKNPQAKKYDRVSYSEALTQKLNVMDATAIALCRENNIPIYVFNFFQKGSFSDAMLHTEKGTLVTGD